MRIRAIDAFRGLTVIGMIFCASISWDAGLPAWMFHGQVPPPDYVFHPEIRVLTWVDLVFPFFIFAMGAAFPFSLRKRVEKGEAWWKTLAAIVKRFVILMAFSLILGHTGAISNAGVRLLAWAALFAALVRTEWKWINYAGWGVLAGVMCLVVLYFKVPFSFGTNDCIIMLLAWVSLFGSLIWLVTRDSLRLRTLAWLLLVAVKVLGFDFLQYLVIAVPGSMVGDVLLKSARAEGDEIRSDGIAAIVGIAAVCVQLWGLYVRNVIADGAITAVLAVVFVLLTFRKRGVFSQIGWMGFAMLLAGICFDPVDGGIAKDYCNTCYLLVTGGMAALLLDGFVALEAKAPRMVLPFLCMTGMNPMIAYTLPGYVIPPIGFFPATPVMGLLRGVVVTALVILITCLFTRWKLFWRT